MVVSRSIPFCNGRKMWLRADCKKVLVYLVSFILAYGAAVPRLLFRKINNGLYRGPSKVKNKRWLCIWWSNWLTKVRPFMLTSLSGPTVWSVKSLRYEEQFLELNILPYHGHCIQVQAAWNISLRLDLSENWPCIQLGKLIKCLSIT